MDVSSFNDIGVIGLISFLTLLPFIIAGGTCFIKFSIVFSLIKNAIGLQQAPSSMTMNAVALLLTAVVMWPVVNKGYEYYESEGVNLSNVESVENFIDNGLSGYKEYLYRFSDKKLLNFFENVYKQQTKKDRTAEREETGAQDLSMITLLASYSLSEIKSAFIIGFYIYLPFVVVDLIVSNVLLALGMMMMSPVTISLPIKLILFVAIDGWTKVASGMVMQYASLWQQGG